MVRTPSRTSSPVRCSSRLRSVHSRPDAAAQVGPALRCRPAPVRRRACVGCGQRPATGKKRTLRHALLTRRPGQPGGAGIFGRQGEAGKQHGTPREAAPDGRVEVRHAGVVERGGEIVDADAPGRQQFAEARIGQVGGGAGEPLRGFQRRGERQVLEAVQRVVMNEVADRRLRRQHVRQVLDPVNQPVAQREIGMGSHVSPRTAGRPGPRCRRPARGAAPARHRGRRSRTPGWRRRRFRSWSCPGSRPAAGRAGRGGR